MLDFPGRQTGADMQTLFGQGDELQAWDAGGIA